MLLLAWFVLVLADKAVRVGIIAYAFARGGATAAGAVAVVQLLPGIVVAPVVMALAERRSPLFVLVAGHAGQAAGMAITAVAIGTGAPVLVAYAGAVLAATAVTASRPAQSVLAPAAAHSAEELTAATAVQGWLNSLGFVLAGVLAGVFLGLGEPTLLFLIGAVATACAGAAVTRVDASGATGDGTRPQSVPRSVRRGLGIVRTDRPIRLLVGLNTAQYVAIGALDVLFVTLAVDVLHRHPGWAGYLSTAFGLGAVLAGAITIALAGLPLLRPVLAAVCVAAAAQCSLVAVHGAAAIVVLLGLVGAGRSVVTTATQTLLQRTARFDLLGQVAGVAEGLRMAGLALGSLLVPVLTSLGGPRLALAGTATVVPMALLLGARGIRHLDAAADIPVTEIALLRSMPHFRALPIPELEGLARRVERHDVPDGTVVLRQGDVGDVFYALAEGAVEVFVDGTSLGTRHRPAGLGEIALLHDVRRTATVVAAGRVVLYAIDGADFLRIVTGHEPTLRRAAAVARERLAQPLPRAEPTSRDS